MEVGPCPSFIEKASETVRTSAVNHQQLSSLSIFATLVVHQKMDDSMSPLGLFVERDRRSTFVVSSRIVVCDRPLPIICSAEK